MAGFLRGRVTDVINIRGNKSAAVPIEELLQRKFEVTGVCVLSLQTQEAEEEIHVVIETPRPVDKVLLAASLRGDLKDVRPSNVHFVVAFPRNDMGKIQRDVLRRRWHEALREFPSCGRLDLLRSQNGMYERVTDDRDRNDDISAQQHQQGQDSPAQSAARKRMLRHSCELAGFEGADQLRIVGHAHFIHPVSRERP
jgi:hypothetical protein